MQIIKIKESELKKITLFLIESNIIFHPIISKDGIPDFSRSINTENLIILDRNIISKMVLLAQSGKVNDSYIRKVISAILVWSKLNGIILSSGFALMEYAYYHKNTEKANIENKLYLKLVNDYSAQLWLDLFNESITEIPPVDISNDNTPFNFLIKSEHYSAHLAEVLYVIKLYLFDNSDPKNKVMKFISWADDNLPLCAYTMTYVCLLFSQKIKQPKLSKNNNYDDIMTFCSNQAWDLTHLSLWSTMYSNENTVGKNYLFVTMDKDLKKIFINTHDVDSNLFVRLFGEKIGLEIDKHYDKVMTYHKKLSLNETEIAAVANEQKESLKLILEQNK